MPSRPRLSNVKRRKPLVPKVDGNSPVGPQNTVNSRNRRGVPSLGAVGPLAHRSPLPPEGLGKPDDGDVDAEASLADDLGIAGRPTKKGIPRRPIRESSNVDLEDSPVYWPRKGPPGLISSTVQAIQGGVQGTAQEVTRRAGIAFEGSPADSFADAVSTIIRGAPGARSARWQKALDVIKSQLPILDPNIGELATRDEDAQFPLEPTAPDVEPEPEPPITLGPPTPVEPPVDYGAIHAEAVETEDPSIIINAKPPVFPIFPPRKTNLPGEGIGDQPAFKVVNGILEQNINVPATQAEWELYFDWMTQMAAYELIQSGVVSITDAVLSLQNQVAIANVYYDLEQRKRNGLLDDEKEILAYSNELSEDLIELRNLKDKDLADWKYYLDGLSQKRTIARTAAATTADREEAFRLSGLSAERAAALAADVRADIRWADTVKLPPTVAGWADAEPGVWIGEYTRVVEGLTTTAKQVLARMSEDPTSVETSELFQLLKDFDMFHMPVGVLFNGEDFVAAPGYEGRDWSPRLQEYLHASKDWMITKPLIITAIKNRIDGAQELKADKARLIMQGEVFAEQMRTSQWETATETLIQSDIIKAATAAYETDKGRAQDGIIQITLQGPLAIAQARYSGLLDILEEQAGYTLDTTLGKDVPDFGDQAPTPQQFRALTYTNRNMVFTLWGQRTGGSVEDFLQAMRATEPRTGFRRTEKVYR